MTDFNKALITFWKSFGLPVILPDASADGVEFPYIAVEIINPGAMGATILTARTWHRVTEAAKQSEVLAERADLLDRIALAIPESGKRIDFNDGFVILYPNTGSFQAYMTDEDDKSILGGRTSYELHYYKMT